jgi:hypothetical protein
MSVDTESREWRTNAKMGRDYCDEIYPDDGRVTYGNEGQHKGDWGRHRKEENLGRLGLVYAKATAS